MELNAGFDKVTVNGTEFVKVVFHSMPMEFGVLIPAAQGEQFITVFAENFRAAMKHRKPCPTCGGEHDETEPHRVERKLIVAPNSGRQFKHPKS